MMSRDELQFVIEKLHPMLVCGRDYWCGHMVHPDDNNLQIEEAKIIGWKPEMPSEPTQAVIDGLWKVYGSEFTITKQGSDARVQRNYLLGQADVLLHKAQDTGNSVFETALRKYRQALREVPNQPGFPVIISWPATPTEQA